MLTIIILILAIIGAVVVADFVRTVIFGMAMAIRKTVVKFRAMRRNQNQNQLVL